jgi:hypothetical protein
MTGHRPDQTSGRTDPAGAPREGEDKVSGFDPAAAPSSTDSEAGGAAAPVQARPAVPDDDAHASSYGTAMRPFANQDPGRKSSSLSFVVLALLVGLAVAGWLAWLYVSS